MTILTRTANNFSKGLNALIEEGGKLTKAEVKALEKIQRAIAEAFMFMQ